MTNVRLLALLALLPSAALAQSTGGATARGRLIFTSVAGGGSSYVTIVVQGTWRVPAVGKASCPDSPLRAGNEKKSLTTFLGFEGTISYESVWVDPYEPPPEELRDPEMREQLARRTKKRVVRASRKFAPQVDKNGFWLGTDPANGHSNLGCLELDNLRKRFFFSEAWVNTMNNGIEPGAYTVEATSFLGMLLPTDNTNWYHGDGGWSFEGTFTSRAAGLKGTVNVEQPKPEPGEEIEGESEQKPPRQHVTYELTIQEEEPVLLIEVGNYQTWLPRGGASPSTPGNSASIYARLMDPTGTQRAREDARRIIFRVVETSSEPGMALNHPDQDAGTKPDFAFLPEKNDSFKVAEGGQEATDEQPTGSYSRAELSSFDNGGYCTVEVRAELTDGRIITGKLKDDRNRTIIPIPRRPDGARIGTAWLDLYGLTADSDPQRDDENEPKHDGTKGDGLTLYEEYRGVYDGKEMKRLHPRVKDLVVENNVGELAEPGLKLFGQLAKIHVTTVTVLPQDRVVNKNSPRAEKQHGVRVKFDSGQLQGDTWAAAMVKGKEGGVRISSPGDITSPKDCEALFVKSGAKSTDPVAGNVAHELGHAVSIHHHSPETEWLQPVDLRKTRVLDEQGKPLSVPLVLNGRKVWEIRPVPQDKAPPKAPDGVMYMPIGRAGGTQSGDALCIMAYRDLYPVFFDTGANELRFVPKMKPPTRVCESNAAAGLNADASGPPAPAGGYWFGNAVRPACMGQLRIRDVR
ncbi:MAG TPA: hypothetical protein VK447_05280 [Myxococcaceae bacterium]|nr:hypothetical protein [Myxococcaceae bacterium]